MSKRAKIYRQFLQFCKWNPNRFTISHGTYSLVVQRSSLLVSMPGQLRDGICIRVMVLPRGVYLGELLERGRWLLEAAEVHLRVLSNGILPSEASVKKS